MSLNCIGKIFLGSLFTLASPAKSELPVNNPDIRTDLDRTTFRHDPRVPEHFTKGVLRGIESTPQGIRNFILKSNEVEPFKVFIWNDLLTDYFRNGMNFYIMQPVVQHLMKKELTFLVR